MAPVELGIYESELDLLTQLVLESPDLETGGELFGLWSHGENPVVMLISGPSSTAHRAPTSFQQPTEIHMSLERLFWNSYGLQVLGIWHSHHRLGIHGLSGGDLQRTKSYALRTGRRLYAEILGYIDEARGRARFLAYAYRDAAQLDGASVNLRVMDGESPIRSRLTERELDPELSECLMLERSTVPELQQIENRLGRPASRQRDSGGGWRVSPAHPATGHYRQTTQSIVDAAGEALASVTLSEWEDIELRMEEDLVIITLSNKEHRTDVSIGIADPRDVQLRRYELSSQDLTLAEDRILDPSLPLNAAYTHLFSGLHVDAKPGTPPRGAARWISRTLGRRTL